MQCKTCLFAIIIIARSAYVPWSLKGRPARLRSVAVLMASRCVHGLAWLPRNDCHLLPQLVHLLLDDRCRASEASHMGTTNQSSAASCASRQHPRQGPPSNKVSTISCLMCPAGLSSRRENIH